MNQDMDKNDTFRPTSVVYRLLNKATVNKPEARYFEGQPIDILYHHLHSPSQVPHEIPLGWRQRAWQ